MDENSILDMPSDIDELEKAKAIESIVLETRNDDDFDETDMLIDEDDDSSRNVTNSLYDADESPKMTSVDNGLESTEIKGDDLDTFEHEHEHGQLTNIACIETPPMPTTPPPQPPPPPPLPPPTTTTTAAATTVTTTTTNQIIVAKSVVGSSTVPTSPKSNKILYVKLIQKGPSLVTKSPPKSISITTLKSKYDKPFDKSEAKKLSPVKMTVEEPTTSNICSIGPNKPVEHTVNLLNNNRILIKSVKNNNHSNSAQIAPIACASKSTVCEGLATTLQTQVKKSCDKDDTKYQVDETSEMAAPCAVNFKQIDQSNANDLKCAPIIMNNGNIDKNELEIKKEQILNENSTDGDNDMKLGDTSIEDKNLLSAKKIKREFEQLQKTVNESKVLSEFVIEHNKRNRRPTKSGKSKHKHNNIIDTNSSIDEKTVMLINRSVSPSSSSVRSASKESDRSATSSFTSSAGKRNTRSMNTDFSAKQKRFLKGIQQVTRGTDDETDNNSGADDDDDDLDYYAKQQPIIIERRKSTVAPKHAFSSEIKVSFTVLVWHS